MTFITVILIGISIYVFIKLVFKTRYTDKDFPMDIVFEKYDNFDFNLNNVEVFDKVDIWLGSKGDNLLRVYPKPSRGSALGFMKSYKYFNLIKLLKQQNRFISTIDAISEDSVTVRISLGKDIKA